jgi:cobalt-zinc-cadmium resistance protein CzcA
MNAIVSFALRQRVLIVVMLLMTLAAGVAGFLNLNIEAYPDPVPPLVDVVTQSTGQSAEEIERYITIPLEIQMAGIPNVQAIRTISLFGLSDVKVQFTYDFTYYQAEQWVVNRLSQLAPLPNGAQPQISPTSPIGEIFRYRVAGPANYSVTDLKTLEDWVLERRFKAVPGVIDVTGWGGKTKTYDIAIDQRKLIGYGLSLPQVLTALGNANINVGGQTVNFGEQSAVVRGVGLIHSADDIRNTLVTNNQGAPVVVGDLAEVHIGNLPRLGIAGYDDADDIVQGIVLMRRGAESVPTIKRVEAEVDKVNSSGLLPPGVHIDRIYDRSDLIHVTTHTVLHNMVAGIALIFFLQWAFLGNLRSAVIVAATIPFALSFAIGLMILRGESANLLSVGAIDFGLVVDATVIMVENIFRHLAEAATRRGLGPSPLHRMRGGGAFGGGFSGKMNTVSIAAAEVSQSIFFAAAIIIAGFVPLFTLSGIEGHIFGPMAKTYAYAIAGGLIATFTIAPALSLLMFPQDLEERETAVVRGLRRIYVPALEFVLANRIVTFAGVVLLALLAVFAVRSLGLEFLPKLEEGNLWIRATFPQSVSLEDSDTYVNRMRLLMTKYPEVQSVVSQHGRPDDGTDATGFFNAEFFVPLKPAATWPGGTSKEQLTLDMTAALTQQFPGVDFNFSQYIQDNVEEAASGVKGENSVKIYGNDLETLEKKADEIAAVLAKVPGITDLAVLRSLGQPTIRIDVDRVRAARYGLSPGDVNAVVQAAIGGQSAGDLYEGGSDRHFPMMVRLSLPYRQNLDAIRRIPVAASASSGGLIQVPLEDVASVRLVSGAAFIYREQQQRYVPIKFSVRGRDLGSAVLEAQRGVDAQVVLPGGYHLEWVGEFGNLQEAVARLSIVVPLSIALIVLLLYLKFGSIRDALLAASVIPMAILGGIFALWLTGTAFSVSSAIGFVALFGIAAMDGILVLSYYHLCLDTGQDRATAMLETCRTQLRPVLMTCIVACVGLVPAALSTGIGSQVQRPLALVVVGGMLLAPALILLVLPVLILQFSKAQELPPEPDRDSPPAGPAVDGGLGEPAPGAGQ